MFDFTVYYGYILELLYTYIVYYAIFITNLDQFVRWIILSTNCTKKLLVTYITLTPTVLGSIARHIHTCLNNLVAR